MNKKTDARQVSRGTCLETCDWEIKREQNKLDRT